MAQPRLLAAREHARRLRAQVVQEQYRFPLRAIIEEWARILPKTRMTARRPIRRQRSESASHISSYAQPVLVEEFIDGDEVTVAVLERAEAPFVLGVQRLVYLPPASRFVYSLQHKRDSAHPGLAQNYVYECPARLPAETVRRVERASLEAYEALGCRDVARFDFRVDASGTPFFLECNPIPNLRPGGVFSITTEQRHRPDG